MNYYEYCVVISNEYYPNIYKELYKYTKNILENIDNEKLHPFPNRDLFYDLVEKIYEQYKYENYNKFKNGEIPYVDFTSNENICLLKDFIKVIIIKNIISKREKYKEYNFYY